MVESPHVVSSAATDAGILVKGGAKRSTRLAGKRSVRFADTADDDDVFEDNAADAADAAEDAVMDEGDEGDDFADNIHGGKKKTALKKTASKKKAAPRKTRGGDGGHAVELFFVARSAHTLKGEGELETYCRQNCNPM